MKSDVLHDLPAKNISDRICTLSPLQQRLYDTFQHSDGAKALEAKAKLTTTATDNKEANGNSNATSSSSSNGHGHGNGATMHVFQALQYLRQLCSHPSLVLTPSHPSYTTITRELRRNKEYILTDYRHSPKLVALRQLLVECGIGVDDTKDNGSDEENDVTAAMSTPTIRHRVLIFAQVSSSDLTSTNLQSSHFIGVCSHQ
jgi:TATA-binding protein-associated factor